MAVQPIVRLGHPALRTPAQAVAPSALAAPEFQALVDDMLETMHDAEGIGLAATQLGLSAQLFVYELESSDARVLINPMVEPEPGELVYDWEGCLSIPDLRGLVPRHPAVKVRGLDRHGTPVAFRAEGLEARVIQHEFDHLNAVVFLDRMRDLQSLAYVDELDEYVLAGADEGSGAVG
jgi:peptide deformylase